MGSAYGAPVRRDGSRGVLNGPFPTRNTRPRGTPQPKWSSPARGPKLGRDAMRGHGEAALDRRRWRARPSLGNRPVTRSLGGGWVGSSWGVPRGLLPAVGRSWCPPSRWVRGTLHLGPPRNPPRDAPPSAPQGKKKSHPPCARRGSAVGAVHPNGHDSVASAPSRSTPTKVSMVTLTTATGRHGNVEQLVYDGGVCPASRPGRVRTGSSNATFRHRVFGACRASWLGRAWTADLVSACG